MANCRTFYMSDGVSCYAVTLVGKCPLGRIAVIKGNRLSRFPESQIIVIKEGFFTAENCKKINDGSRILLNPMIPYIEQDASLQDIKI